MGESLLSACLSVNPNLDSQLFLKFLFGFLIKGIEGFIYLIYSVFSGLQLFGIGMMIKMFNPELIYFIHCFCWMILVEFYLYTVLLLYEFIIIDFRSSNKIESNHVDD